jgi:hypothetical protein
MLLAKCAVILPVLCCTGVLVGLLGTGVGHRGPSAGYLVLRHRDN